MTFVLAILPLVLAGASPSGVADRRCEAAAAYVATVLDGKWKTPAVFTTAPIGVSDPLPAHPRWFDSKTGKRGAVPTAALMVRVAREREASAVASCARIRSMLTARHVAFGSAAELADPTMNGEDPNESQEVGVSLPIVSADGAEAVLVCSVVAGPGAASLRLLYLRRSGSAQWRVVSEALLLLA